MAVIAHPSLFKPEDLDVRCSQIVPEYLLSFTSQIYVEKSKAPLLINSCEHDEMFPKSMGEEADKKFASFAPGYRRTYYEGVSHGFATRGDLVRFLEVSIRVFRSLFRVILHPNVQSDPTVKAAKDDAFKESVEWLIKYLE